MNDVLKILNTRPDSHKSSNLLDDVRGMGAENVAANDLAGIAHKDLAEAVRLAHAHSLAVGSEEGL